MKRMLLFLDFDIIQYGINGIVNNVHVEKILDHF